MLQFEHHILVIAAAMIVSLLLALFIYNNDIRFKSAKPSTRIVLVFLRFLSLCTLVLLLFKPKLIQEFKTVEKPIIVLLQDASSSILNHNDSNFYKNELQELLALNQEELEEDYTFHSYLFSDSLFQSDKPNYKGKRTNISLALDNISVRYFNRNLAAIILASDGNYNQGANPIYTAKNLNTPVYSLALGNDSVYPDISIQNVQYNEIAYLGNKFPLNFEIYSNTKSTEKNKIEIYHKGKLQYVEWVNIDVAKPLEKELLLEANEAGIQHYHIQISSFSGEKNIDNNQYDIAVDILDNMQKILILSSVPHPDIAALQSALLQGDNYEVSTSLIDNFKGQIKDYNLIILHQLPSKSNQKLISDIVDSDISILFIGGSNVNWSSFNEAQSIAKVRFKNSYQEVFPHLQEIFTPFELSSSCKSFLRQTPPLIAPFGTIDNENVDHSLFTQKIEGINTNNQLLSFGLHNNKKVALLLAEGLWRWKLYDYKRNKNHDNFNELIQSISQYLTLNKDKRKLRLEYQKVISQGEALKIKAQLYNDNYQLVKDAAIRLKITDDKNTENMYSFHTVDQNYLLSLNNLAVGNYTFEVTSQYKEDKTTLYGELTVQKSSLELQELTANWDLLHKVSDQSGGEFISKEKVAELSSIIKQKTPKNSKTYFNKKLSDIINQKLIFLLLLLSLCLEWLIRKNLGTH